MPTINSILREMKDIPVDRLEEVYQFVHSLPSKVQTTVRRRNKIISCGGAFSDMSDKDYADLRKTKETRT